VCKVALLFLLILAQKHEKTNKGKERRTARTNLGPAQALYSQPRLALDPDRAQNAKEKKKRSLISKRWIATTVEASIPAFEL